MFNRFVAKSFEVGVAKEVMGMHGQLFFRCRVIKFLWGGVAKPFRCGVTL